MKTTIPLFLLSLLLPACMASHQVHMEPVRIEPIRVTMDVNVHVDRAGDRADDPEPLTEPVAATAGGDRPARDANER